MSQNFFAKSRYTFIAMGVLSFFIVLFLYKINSKSKSLPIYNPIDVNPKLVDESLLNKSKNHTIAPFELTDQDGNTITATTFDNTIYVADFFLQGVQPYVLS